MSSAAATVTIRVPLSELSQYADEECASEFLRGKLRAEGASLDGGSIRRFLDVTAQCIVVRWTPTGRA